MNFRPLFALLPLLAAFVPAHAPAQTYPVKPIRFVVPFAPGGASDVLARLVGQKLAERLGQPVVVENKPGAATTVGAAEVARAPADGYTLLLAPAPFVIAPLMYQNLPYDAARDFTGVALLASSPLILTAHPSVAATTPQELLALAKSKPGAIMYGSPGNGSVPHLATELFKMRTGADFTHVPYKGGGPAVSDLVAGHIGVMFASPIEVSQHVAAGKLRYIVASTKDRVPSLPGVPTVGELGIAGFDVVAWFGVVAPAATPRAIVEKVSSEIGRFLLLPDIRKLLNGQGVEPYIHTPEQFAALIRSDHEKWIKVIKAANIKLEN